MVKLPVVLTNNLFTLFSIVSDNIQKMFTTGPETYAAFRAQNVGYAPIRNETTPRPNLQAPPPSVPAKRKRLTTIIGSNDSAGLVIQGGTGWPDRIGEDADGTNPPISGDSYRGYQYPIRYSGAGYMSFESPVGLPGIKGDVNIDGNLLVNGTVTHTGGGGGGGGELQVLIAGGDNALIRITNDDPGEGNQYPTAPTNLAAAGLRGFFKVDNDKCFYQIEVKWSANASPSGDVLAIPLVDCGLPLPVQKVDTQPYFVSTGNVVRTKGILIPDVHDGLKLDLELDKYVLNPSFQPYFWICVERHTQGDTDDGVLYIDETDIQNEAGYIQFSGWYFVKPL